MKELLIKTTHYALVRPWSFVVNCLYWIINFKKYRKTKIDIAIIKVEIESEEDVISKMKTFRWRKDAFIDWIPWIKTIVARNLQDDCDGAAVLAKWMLDWVGIEADLVVLYGHPCHMVCVTKDRKLMISNEEGVYLDPENWEKEVLDHFMGRYDRVVVL